MLCHDSLFPLPVFLFLLENLKPTPKLKELYSELHLDSPVVNILLYLLYIYNYSTFFLC